MNQKTNLITFKENHFFFKKDTCDLLIKTTATQLVV